jgi:lipoyl(octanoyl) transferase
MLLVLEHPPVYTKGKRSEPGDLPMGEDWYRAQGIEVCDTDRGGRVTYHGPGQLVAYPIMTVERVADFVHSMEDAMVAALADEGVAAEPRDTPFTGVWAGDGKIGSIGVRVREGVSMHGLAVNVDNDLQPFEWIVPCGIDHVRMTSVSRETGRAGSLPCFRKRMAYRFAEAFGRRQRLVSLGRLHEREEAGSRAPAGVPA